MILSFKEFSFKPTASVVIREELTPKQKQVVNTWTGGRSSSPEADRISGSVFPEGQSRISVPLTHPETPADPNPEVEDHLQRNGYAIKDYRTGKATDKYGREVNIGRALTRTKADPDLISTFANDPTRAASRQAADDDLHVVISKHPYDIAGMSTDRGWNSCMNMRGGEMNHYLEPAVQEGMHVAYLARRSDPDLKNPLARISLVPHTSENGDTILRPEDKTYGTSDSSFHNTVQKWAEENFPMKDGTIYQRNQEVYNDSPLESSPTWSEYSHYDSSRNGSFNSLWNSPVVGDRAQAFAKHPEKITPQHIQQVMDEYNSAEPNTKKENFSQEYWQKAAPYAAALNHPLISEDQLRNAVLGKDPQMRMIGARSTMLGKYPNLIQQVFDSKDNDLISKVLNRRNNPVKLTPDQIDQALKSKDPNLITYSLAHPDFSETNFLTTSKWPKAQREDYGYDLDDAAGRLGYDSPKEAISAYKTGKLAEQKMINFKNFLFEERKDPDSTTLHAFDMDETLMAHDHNKLRVHVLDPNGNRVRTLSNQEFNTHQLPPGHSYDFSEFRSSDVFGQSASPIRKMIAKLKAIHKNNKNVEILTARGDMDDKDKFAHHMKKYGIDINQVHVRRAGNLPGKPADTKAAVMSDLIAKNGYRKVHLYDDSADNLNAFLKLKRQHPDVEFHAHHVQHNPETGEVTVTSRKV